MIYLLRRTDAIDYDEYDSAVIVAGSEEEARAIAVEENLWGAGWDDYIDCDEVSPEDSYGVVLSSFNAG